MGWGVKQFGRGKGMTDEQASACLFIWFLQSLTFLFMYSEKTSMNSYLLELLIYGKFGRICLNMFAQEIVHYSVFLFLFPAKAVTGIVVGKLGVAPIEDYRWIAGCAPSSLAWKDLIGFTFYISAICRS